MIDPHKYIVFNREEFMRMMEPRAMNFATSEIHVGEVLATELDDAVVIRKRDVFAQTALSSYAHGILCAIEIARSPKAIDTDYLYELADYFAGAADDAGARVPD